MMNYSLLTNVCFLVSKNSFNWLLFPPFLIWVPDSEELQSAFVKVYLNFWQMRQLAIVTLVPSWWLVQSISSIQLWIQMVPHILCWLFCFFRDHPIKNGLWLKLNQLLMATMSALEGLSSVIPYMTYHIIILTRYCCISSETALTISSA